MATQSDYAPQAYGHAAHEHENKPSRPLPIFVLYGCCLRLHGSFAEAVSLFDDGAYGKCPSSRGRPTPNLEPASKKRRVQDGEHTHSDSQALDSGPAQGWLQLTLEEGFYLAYVVGRIRIRLRELDVTEVDAESAWRTFCAAQPSFAHGYAAYRHFRSTGWAPRAGIKYGIDHLLYSSEGLTTAMALGEHHHAPYAALVHHGSAPITWRRLQSTSRLACQVSKHLLVAMVDGECPSGGGYAALENLTVSEFTLDRWEPERDRGSTAGLKE